jgi:hypothetical protein
MRFRRRFRAKRSHAWFSLAELFTSSPARNFSSTPAERLPEKPEHVVQLLANNLW